MLLHKQKFTAAVMALLIPALVRAQEAAAPAAAEVVEDKAWFTANPVLVGLALVLLFLLVAVYFTGKVVKNLTHIASQKIREDRKKNTSATLIALMVGMGTLLSSTTTLAQDAAAISAEAAANSFINGIPKTEFYVLIIVLLVMVTALTALMWRVNKILKFYRGNLEPVTSQTATAAAVTAKAPTWWDKINGTVPMEKEKDLLLDHDYDGIRELDNSLPPWWLYGFYATIIFACIYLWRHHVTHTAPSQAEEFIAEVKEGEALKAKFLATAGNNVDENTITLSTNAADINAGKAIFEQACAACHLKDGGGSVGPNLTDDYWLHGGTIQDVFKTIKYGVVEKGMQSWKDTYTPMQIAQLSNFIMSLKGTKPQTAKPPQGDLVKATEGSTNNTSGTAPETDTTKKATPEAAPAAGVKQ